MTDTDAEESLRPASQPARGRRNLDLQPDDFGQAPSLREAVEILDDHDIDDGFSLPSSPQYVSIMYG